MSRAMWIAQLALLIIPAGFANPPVSQEIPENCEEGVQESDALYLICMPANKPWNGDLVVYAHGYVAFNEPLAFQDLELPDGTFLPDLVNALGYAFATSSYSRNGLAVREGLADMQDLVSIFAESEGDPNVVYITGASEGGLITTLAVEQSPETFDGGLAACGPIGDFRSQIKYWGDFRIVFDVLFPGIIPGSAVEIPDDVIENWDTVYLPAIEQALESDPDAVDQLLAVSEAPIAIDDPDTAKETVLGLLWYNVFSTNDGVDRLGGQPFGNRFTIYRGSSNDFFLNRTAERLGAEQAPIEEIETYYQTSGLLESPLVTIHTLRDPIVPFEHQPAYHAKVLNNGSSSQYAGISIPRYGHCEFNKIEVLVAFALLVLKTTGQELVGVDDLLPDQADWDEYIRMAREYEVIK